MLYSISHIKDQLKECVSYPETKGNQRAIADCIEEETNNNLVKVFGNNAVLPASVKSIDDITIDSILIDHKTSDVDRKFKMPNLISIDRLRRNVISENKNLIYNFILYSSNLKIITEVFQIEYYKLNWDHLQISNLGKGQLQIKNMSAFIKSPISNLTKEEWIKKLFSEAVTFYEKQEIKAKNEKNKWI